jgi:DNA excision repair protein ERCC-3
VRDYLGDQLGPDRFLIAPAFRGVLKQALIAVGYPAEDLAGYTEGAALPIQLRDLEPPGR